MQHIFLRQFNDRFGDRPSTDSVIRSVSLSSKIYLSTCLLVCESISLSITNVYCPWLKTYLFQTDAPKSKQYKLVNIQKICGGDFGQP